MAEFTRESLQYAPADMWRYASLLPAVSDKNLVSMGEGWTPIIQVRSPAQVWIKDEGANPGGLWSARGASCAASVARESGWGEVALPLERDAAASCAAYCAAAGIKCFMREPNAECEIFGAVEGHAGQDLTNAFHAGMKTLAYEIAEQFEWRPPSTVIAPQGFSPEILEAGFNDLLQMGWIAEAPVVQAAQPQNLSAVIDRAIALAKSEGLLIAPETVACFEHVRDEPALVVNLVAGARYLYLYERRFPRPATETEKLGGLITPR